MALFDIVFGVVVCMICFALIKSAFGWLHNQQAPKESYEAKLVAKRMQVSGANGSYTNYYATFEWQGQRQEFRLSAKGYGLLVEGDRGQLQFQGTRFLSFERR